MTQPMPVSRRIGYIGDHTARNVPCAITKSLRHGYRYRAVDVGISGHFRFSKTELTPGAIADGCHSGSFITTAVDHGWQGGSIITIVVIDMIGWQGKIYHPSYHAPDGHFRQIDQKRRRRHSCHRHLCPTRSNSASHPFCRAVYRNNQCNGERIRVFTCSVIGIRTDNPVNAGSLSVA